MQLLGYIKDQAGVSKVGVTVELYTAANYDAAGAVTSSTTTNANGRWAFTGLAAGSWVVKCTDGTKVLVLDGRSEIQIAKLSLTEAGKIYLADELLATTDHTCTGEILSGIAGEALAFPDLVYLKSDGKFWKTDADAIGTTEGILAIAIATISADATGDFLTGGFIRDDTWNWTVGGAVYVSGTAAGLTQTEPVISRKVGYALSADVLHFQPVVLSPIGAAVLQFGGGLIAGAPGANTIYALLEFDQSYSGTKTYSGYYILCPKAGVIKNLRIAASATAGKDIAFTVEKNDVNTALTATLLAAGTTASDTTNSFTVAAGDLISVEATHTDALTATPNALVSMSYVSYAF